MIRVMLSVLISLIAAIVVGGASYFRWWGVTYRGKKLTQTWVRVLQAVLIALFVGVTVLLIIAPHEGPRDPR
jgi:hypothetical protein